MTEAKFEALKTIKKAVPRIASKIWINGDFGDIRTAEDLTEVEQNIIYGLDCVKSISKNVAAGTWCICV